MGIIGSRLGMAQTGSMRGRVLLDALSVQRRQLLGFYLQMTTNMWNEQKYRVAVLKRAWFQRSRELPGRLKKRLRYWNIKYGSTKIDIGLCFSLHNI
jgi:hypothetical protein